ncbi:methanethiol S-methyltransferase [Pinirhizobacter sp.]|jgi:protein-S-isoprenylcysteine O-methyltransferase Ste14|uniref:methanethiol S-methyltransferase n=1 Tax=Pinirhizobacter sp. TaxID=2950432 RepID=UPI002F428586
MQRMVAVGFALVAYILFFASFLWLIAFLGDVKIFPTRINDAVNGTPVAQAIGVDLLLIALFGIQHSVMARPGFKARLTRIVPASVERSIYVLAAAAALAIMLGYWHTLGGAIWDVREGAAAPLIWAVFATGWAVVLLSTFLINHFELFGLSQAWHHGRAREDRPPQLREPLLYRWVRHPLYLGFIIAFWATPHLTMSHLLFAAGMTFYIFIGIAHEERDLLAHFGPAYDDYRKRVGMIVPGMGRRQGRPND